MPTTANLIAFASLAVAVVLTPGPNMIYMISRAITQGRLAGLIAYSGVALGFVGYLLCAAFGLTAIVFAVPYAYDVLRFVGAAYIAWLAFEALRPGGKSPFQVRTLPVASTRPRRRCARVSASVFTVRSSGGSWRCASAILRARSSP